MDIIVCVKAVLDPETVPHYVVSGGGLHIDEQNKKIVPTGITTVISLYDELAAEAALRIRDQLGTGVTITAVSLGTEESETVLRRVLAMGGDRGILLKDEAFGDANDFVIAHALAAAVSKIGHFDLILCGRQAADVDSGVVGSGLAELLDVPSVTIAKDIQVEGGTVRVERVATDEIQVVETTLPALLTISNELGEPRYPTVPGLIKAKRKEVTVWNAEDLGLDLELIRSQAASLSLEKISIVETHGQCEFVRGESPQDMATKLIEKLMNEGVLQR